MIKNLESSIFLKLKFLYMDTKTLLKIIKYNKNLQNKINIKLLDYKMVSRHYIIYESEGKAKEYLSRNNTLVFEGEYLNGKKNGKGKEYDVSGNILFEGDYLNGFRDGKGKEYNDDYSGKLIYEGEYSNGFRDGKGKEYDFFGNLKFEGNYKVGIRNGYGKEYNEN